MHNTDNNFDLFGHAADAQLLANLDHMQFEESEKWPEVLREMHDLLKTSLSEAGADSRLSLLLLSRICEHFGGLQFYVPRGKALSSMITSLKIWEEFNGRNVDVLAKRYTVSAQHIWRVVAKMRASEMKRRQADLFEH